MAQYHITHSCGHTVTHQLYGRTRSREARQAWLMDHSCRECWQSEKNQKRTEASAEAAAANAADGLPELVGTAKQVGWAETIRRKIIDDIARDMQHAKPATDDDIEAGLLRAVQADASAPCRWMVWADRVEELGKDSDNCRAVARLLTMAEARWWIDGRSESWVNLLHKTEEV